MHVMCTMRQMHLHMHQTLVGKEMSCSQTMNTNVLKIRTATPQLPYYVCLTPQPQCVNVQTPYCAKRAATGLGVVCAPKSPPRHVQHVQKPPVMMQHTWWRTQVPLHAGSGPTNQRTLHILQVPTVLQQCSESQVQSGQTQILARVY